MWGQPPSAVQASEAGLKFFYITPQALSHPQQHIHRELIE